MESIIKTVLVEQIREKHITVRSIHAQIEKICAADQRCQWISLSTLERRLQRPGDMSSDELRLIRDAVKMIVSDSVWIHVRRHITERMRLNYASQIDRAVENGFALHQQLVDYSGFEDDPVFYNQILNFYYAAPKHLRDFWGKTLETYLLLPDIAKASILCGSYIGHSVMKDEAYNRKVLEFIDYFPLFQGINIIGRLDNKDVALLGKLMLAAASTIDADTVPQKYWEYAVHRSKIVLTNTARRRLSSDAKEFMRLATSYKHSVKDYPVDAADFIHGICFILFIDRVEWLLAYTTSVFYYNLEQTENRYYLQREYHSRGCTGFRFTDKELDYLCELLFSLEN